MKDITYDGVSCGRCNNRLFKVIADFEKRYILCICPICYTKIYLVGPGDMYDLDNQD
jgi:hypothetical protein